MPIKISDLARDRRSIQVPFGDQLLEVTYLPSAFTAELEGRDAQLRAQGRPLAALALQLAESVIAWDLEDDRGQPVAVSREAMELLGLDALTRIHLAIRDDLLPNLRAGSG